MDVTTLEQLRTPAGVALLTEADRAYGVEDEFALGVRLRRNNPVDLVASALTLARLRQRAVAKFDRRDAARMFFTVDGYEQATRAVVARHRAARIVTKLNANEPVADLCCGIGGDLVAMARAGLDVTGVEADPLTAATARANVEALGLTRSARIVAADATRFDRPGYQVVTCDPARRNARGRTFDPDSYRPSWAFVTELSAGSACVKVAPGIPHDRVPDGVEAEWVSDSGEVKEAALWSGRFAESGVRRRATVLPVGASITDADDPGPSGVAAPGR
ncbi:MAG: class I SAM-dependent methyltransferase, partial [Jiangellaceae bacterium]